MHLFVKYSHLKAEKTRKTLNFTPFSINFVKSIDKKSDSSIIEL